MKKFVPVFLALLLATGCTSVPVDVVDSVEVLQLNTHKLSEGYAELLDDYEDLYYAHVLVTAPKKTDESDEAFAAREKAELADIAEAKAEWEKSSKHAKMLMSANNTLADKILEWSVLNKEDE